MRRTIFIAIMVEETVKEMFSKLAKKEKKTQTEFLLDLMELYRKSK